MRIRNVVMVLLVTCGIALGAVACSGSDDGIPTPTDPVLAEGQTVYKGNCAGCHGTKGGGGQGPKLAGLVEARYPNIDDHIAIITNGKGGSMPSFKDRLTAEQIEAVARYEREVL